MRVTRVDQLFPGQRLGRSVRTRSGQVLLSAGVELTSKYIQRLQSFGYASVYVEDADTSDIEVEQPISEEYRVGVEAEMSETFDAVGRLAADNRKSAGQAAQDSFGAARNTSKELVSRTARAIDTIAKRGEELVDKLRQQEVITGLNSLKSHDNYTLQHSIDVAVTGIVLAGKLGWDPIRIRAFGIGCLLHDIGKVFIDPAILNKPGPLNAEETETLKAHPLLGYHLIKSTAPTLGSLIPVVALQHHERQDGTGYSRGLKGTNRLGGGATVSAGWVGAKPTKRGATAINSTALIHDFGALAAVVDVYDAMTSDRPYRQGYHPNRALEIIGGMSGTHLNRECVKLLMETIPPYPVLSEVRVTSGKYAGWTGIVAHVPPTDLAHPVVRLLCNDNSQRTNTIEIDLSVERDVAIRPFGRSVGSGVDEEAVFGAIAGSGPKNNNAALRALPLPVREFLEQFDVSALEDVA